MHTNICLKGNTNGSMNGRSQTETILEAEEGGFFLLISRIVFIFFLIFFSLLFLFVFLFV